MASGIRFSTQKVNFCSVQLTWNKRVSCLLMPLPALHYIRIPEHDERDLRRNNRKEWEIVQKIKDDENNSLWTKLSSQPNAARLKVCGDGIQCIKKTDRRAKLRGLIIQHVAISLYFLNINIHSTAWYSTALSWLVGLDNNFLFLVLHVLSVLSCYNLFGSSNQNQTGSIIYLCFSTLKNILRQLYTSTISFSWMGGLEKTKCKPPNKTSCCKEKSWLWYTFYSEASSIYDPPVLWTPSLLYL
jgi:hypothetical protein